MKPIVTGTLIAVTTLSLTANALLYLRWSTSRPLATVGSQVITKKDYTDAVDYQTQGAILKKMVLADLVTQAAARAGLTPSGADVEARLADVRRRDPQSLAAADQDPTRMAEMRQDIQTELALENLRAQDVTVSDAEVTAFYDRHKKAFDLPAQVQTTLVVTENSVDAAQAAGLLKQDIGVDVISRQPRLHVVGVNGFTVDLNALPSALSQRLTAAVMHMHPGDVQTIPIGKYYIVARVTRSAEPGVPPLSQIRPLVTRLAALDKAVPAPVELARLYQAAKPQFTVAKYETYFQDLSRQDVAASIGKETKTASAQ